MGGSKKNRQVRYYYPRRNLDHHRLPVHPNTLQFNPGQAPFVPIRPNLWNPNIQARFQAPPRQPQRQPFYAPHQPFRPSVSAIRSGDTVYYCYGTDQYRPPAQMIPPPQQPHCCRYPIQAPGPYQFYPPPPQEQVLQFHQSWDSCSSAPPPAVPPQAIRYSYYPPPPMQQPQSDGATYYSFNVPYPQPQVMGQYHQMPYGGLSVQEPNQYYMATPQSQASFQPMNFGCSYATEPVPFPAQYDSPSLLPQTHSMDDTNAVNEASDQEEELCENAQGAPTISPEEVLMREPDEIIPVGEQAPSTDEAVSGEDHAPSPEETIQREDQAPLLEDTIAEGESQVSSQEAIREGEDPAPLPEEASPVEESQAQSSVESFQEGAGKVPPAEETIKEQNNDSPPLEESAFTSLQDAVASSSGTQALAAGGPIPLPKVSIPIILLGQRAFPGIQDQCKIKITSKMKAEGCAFCRSTGESVEVWHSHKLRVDGKTICPILRKYVCPICQATGDNAHTLNYCPENKDAQIATAKIRTGHNSAGKRLWNRHPSRRHR